MNYVTKFNVEAIDMERTKDLIMRPGKVIFVKRGYEPEEAVWNVDENGIRLSPLRKKKWTTRFWNFLRINRITLR